MLGLDGVDLAYHIKEQSARTQVVIMTEHEKEVVLKKSNAACADLIIFKPFRLQRLMKTIQKAPLAS